MLFLMFMARTLATHFPLVVMFFENFASMSPLFGAWLAHEIHAAHVHHFPSLRHLGA